jgi:hypothetical protein
VNRATEEDLLGYTLGALEPDDYDRVDAIVRENEILRVQIEQLRRRLAPLDGLAPPSKPRAGLARRTCECIATVPLEPLTTQAGPLAQSRGLVPRKNAQRNWFTERKEYVPGTGSRSVLEFAIVAVILMLLAAITVPAIQTSRYYARLASCQGNLKTIGLSLLDYANMHGGRHLPIPQDKKLGIAGIFGPTLLQSGYVSDPGIFLCNGSPSSQKSVPVIPTVEQIELAEGSDLARLQRMAGGDYAYNLGCLVNGKYMTARNSGRPNYALLADSPSHDLAGRTSSNHGGNGQNVFFEDGHYDFLVSPVVDGASIYENDQGIVAPGTCPEDCVVASSPTPIIQSIFISN